MKADDLEKLYPGLAEELNKNGELGPQDISIEISHSGLPTMLIKGIYIHSPRDPVKEAQRLAQAALGTDFDKTAIASDNSPIIILGFGMGYSAESAAQLQPKRPLIIVERHRELIKKALEARDLTWLLSQNQLIFVLGDNPNGVMNALSLFKNHRTKKNPVIKTRALTNLDLEWYAAVENNITAWTAGDEVNKATLNRFGKRWVRNLSKNLYAVRDYPGINRLGGLLKCKDVKDAIPVFLAAAGPSLDTTADILGEIKSRCLIIAVDTSLRFLLSRGVEPDFVVSVDPQYWNFLHIAGLKSKHTRLIAESAVYPSCLNHSFGGAFLGASLYPVGRYIEKRVDPKGDLGAGGSVATSAWDFARILGAGTIWIAGLDLSFPGQKTHFKGALFEERILTESNRFNTAEGGSFRILRDGQLFPAQSMNGNKVMTDKRLSLYASWFENRFQTHSDVKNISISGEGLAIKGMELSSREAVLALPKRRGEIDALLQERYSTLENEYNNAVFADERQEKYKKAVKSLISGLENIKTIAEKAAVEAERAILNNKLEKSSVNEEQKTIKILDQAMSALNNSEVKEVAGFLFPDFDKNQGNSSSKNSFTSYLETSARFFRILAETTGYNYDCFKRKTAG